MKVKQKLTNDQPLLKKDLKYLVFKLTCYKFIANHVTSHTERRAYAILLIGVDNLHYYMI